jgi:hypothetical protein
LASSVRVLSSGSLSWGRAVLVALALGLSLGLAAAPAAAQEPKEPSAADRESARALMEQGRGEFEQGQYEAALGHFQAADDIMHVTSTGLWVGKSLVELHRLIEARDKLLAVGRIPESADVSDALKEARAEAATLQSELAERIPEIRFVVKGLAAGVEVVIKVGDEEVRADVPRKVDPGEHAVRATAEGYQPVEVKVAIAERQSLPVELAFERDDSSQPISGEEPDPTGYYVALGVSFGFAGVGAIVGGITGGLSLAAASDAKEGCFTETECPTENEDDADRSLLLAHISTVSFIVAGVGAAAGVITLIIGPPTSDTAIEPAIGPGWAGVRGRF